MAVLILGAVLIIVGALAISFPELCASLKSKDPDRWKLLGSPHGYAFSDLGSTIGVFTWVLSRGFESSPSDEVGALGKKALSKALFAKYCLLAGTFLALVGFGLAVAGIWV